MVNNRINCNNCCYSELYIMFHQSLLSCWAAILIYILLFNISIYFILVEIVMETECQMYHYFKLFKKIWNIKLHNICFSHKIIACNLSRRMKKWTNIACNNMYTKHYFWKRHWETMPAVAPTQRATFMSAYTVTTDADAYPSAAPRPRLPLCWSLFNGFQQ